MCADKNGFKNAFLHISHRANLASKAFFFLRHFLVWFGISELQCGHISGEI
jgi:hypothetical protein